MNLPPLPDILIDVPPTTKFKRGDVVRLNSGGPAMTVTDVKEDLAKCWWFDSTLQVAYADIPTACLTLVSAPVSTGEDRPTPPAGYELKLGKTLYSFPAGTLEWNFSMSCWGGPFSRDYAKESLLEYGWYAIPVTP